MINGTSRNTQLPKGANIDNIQYPAFTFSAWVCFNDSSHNNYVKGKCPIDDVNTYYGTIIFGENIQIFIRWSDAKMYTRIGVGYEWQSWIEVASVSDLDSLKKSVSNGKSSVASAITDCGVATAADDSFDTMAANIRKACSNTAKPFGFGMSSSYFATPIKTHKMGSNQNSFIIQEAGTYRCCMAGYGGNYQVTLTVNGSVKFNSAKTMDAYIDLNAGDNVYMRTIADANGVCLIAGALGMV